MKRNSGEIKQWEKTELETRRQIKSLKTSKIKMFRLINQVINYCGLIIVFSFRESFI